MAIRLITTPLADDRETKYTLIKTAWGWMGFACRDTCLCRLILPGLSKNAIIKIFHSEWPSIEYARNLLPPLQQSIVDFFQARPTNFDCNVDVSWASPFARRVYQACTRIKPAQTATYAELAQKAGSPQAARAVGAILAANRTPLIIPCHRVVRSDGKLGGFSAPGGVDLKKRLITHESKILTEIFHELYINHCK